MRKLSNRVISCLLCLICMLPLSPVQVFAAGAIDVNKAVHLKIQYIHDKTPVSDVPFDLYYVASVDAYGEFTLAGDFQKYPVVVSGLSTDAWRTLAETLAVYADRDQLKPLDSGKTNAEGNLSFPNKQPSLKPGLYLAVGRKLVKSGYTYTTKPFLVALPNLDRENNAWVYETRLLLSLTNAVGAGRMRQAARELVKAYIHGVESAALDDVFELLAWNQGIGFFSSEIGPSALFQAYKLIKNGEKQGKSREDICSALREKFGEKNPEMQVLH